MNRSATIRTSRSRQAVVSSLVVISVVLSACGGSDAPAQPASGDSQTSNNDSQSVNDDAPTGELASDGVASEILDALPADGEESLDKAIGSLDAEQRFGISASQLEPEPKVEVNGKDIRFVFPGGSVGNATFDCIVGGVIALDDETLTLVYPDGEKVC